MDFQRKNLNIFFDIYIFDFKINKNKLSEKLTLIYITLLYLIN